MPNHTSTSASQFDAVMLPCEGMDNICPPSIIVHSVSSLISTAFNIIHLVILRNVSQLRGKPYFLVLMHLTFVDITCGISSFITSTCAFRRWTALNDIGFGAAAFTLLNWCLSMRYYVLLLAMYEKYLAICTPLHYEGSFFIRHVHICVVLVWTAALGLAVLTTVMGISGLCLHELYGPSTLLASNTNEISFTLGFGIAIFIVFSSVLAKLMMELHKMKKRAREQDVLLIQATIYIVIIAITYYVFLFPFLVSLVYMLAAGKSSIVLDSVSFWMVNLYGYVNNIIYGWKTKAYRTQARLLLKKVFVWNCKPEQQVGPE